MDDIENVELPNCSNCLEPLEPADVRRLDLLGMRVP